MSGKILIIDDEVKLRSLLVRVIGLEGYTISEAANIKSAKKLLEKEEPDVILCDVKLPDGSGVDFVAAAKATHPFAEIILLTAYGNIPDGIQAMKNGAFDYITKGDDNDKIIPLISRAMDKVLLHKRVLQLEKQVGKKYSFDSVIGTAKPLLDAITLALKVAPTETTVLLLGETGTGKEVIAQAIHNDSRRSGKSFLAINCAAFSKDLLESEIFGHKEGAFTGATKDKKGLVEEASGGTLFLDEIGEMPLDLQSKMLRVLETSEFFKVGDTKPTRVNVRFIAATNRHLHEEVAQGHFREDLYYRLNVFAIELPPLRERKQDIPALANYFIHWFSSKINKKIKGITAEAEELLKQHAWKGNIRELKNVIERAVILEDGSEITLNSLPLDLQSALPDGDSRFDLAVIEKMHIQKVLAHAGGNKTETAKLLNIGLTTLYRKMEEYGITR
jgi:two-component system, NtrC family, response regulator